MADDLLVIIPTRSRPHAIPEIMQAWDDTGATADVLFCVDKDDPELAAYKQQAKALADDSRVRFVFWARRRLVGTLNQAAVKNADSYRFLAFMGDDHRPRSADRPWDERFRECLGGGPGIVYGNDLLQGENLPTQCAMTSDIIRAIGYMAPPELTHLAVDNFWLDLGRAADCIRYLPDVVVEHMHPIAGKSEWTEGHLRVNAQSMYGRDLAQYALYQRVQLPGVVAKVQALRGDA